MKAIKIGKFNFENKVWNGISQGAKDFITYLLTYDVSKRPTAEKAIQHPWIQEQSVLKVDESFAKNTLDNLTKFHSHNMMKAATLTFIGSQLLSKDEIKDGYINHFGRLISDKEIDVMFDAVDTD